MTDKELMDHLNDLYPKTLEEWKLFYLAALEHNRLLISEYKEALSDAQYFLCESRAAEKYVESEQFKNLQAYKGEQQ